MARAAELAGVDRIVVSDHVVFGEHLDVYADPTTGGVEGGRQPTGPEVDAELALDADGRFLALRWTGTHNAGAYVEGTGAIPIIFSLMLASTVYDIPAVAVTSSLVFTNTAPTTPYRGAGRPEAVYIMERLVDQAAREMDIDPAELRRKNLIRRDAFPYQTHDRLDLRYRELCRGNGEVPGPGRLERLCRAPHGERGRRQMSRP